LHGTLQILPFALTIFLTSLGFEQGGAGGTNREELPLRLLAAHGDADPLCATIGPGDHWIYIQEGTVLRRLAGHRSENALEERGVAQLDGVAHGLAATRDGVWVAAGERGLLWVSFDEAGRGVVRRVEGENVPGRGMMCVDLALDGKELWVLYASEDVSEVHKVSAGGTLLLRRTVAGRRLRAVAGRGRVAWVGGDGSWFAKILWHQDDVVTVQEGPPLRSPTSSQIAAPVLDIVLGRSHLHAVCDGPEVFTMDTRSAFGADTPVIVTSFGKGREHAAHLAIKGDRLAIACNRGPRSAMDGGPFGLCGTMGPGFTIGDTNPAKLKLAASELLVIAREAGNGLEVQGVMEVGPHGWRSLSMGKGVTVECHLTRGLEVRTLPAANRPAKVVASRQTMGFPAVDGVTSLIVPGLALFGTDSQGALARGQLLFGSEGTLTPVAGSEDLSPIGLRVGAQWIEPDKTPSTEWFLSGYGPAPRLFRLRHQVLAGVAMTDWDSWPLSLPNDPDGRRGHTYFQSTIDGDAVLLTRYGSREGLLGYSAESLVRAANGSPPGTTITLVPRWSAPTQTTTDPNPAGALDVTVVSWPDGRRVAAVAAGHGRPSGAATRGGPRMVIFALGPGTPTLLAEFEGKQAGTTVAIDSAWIDGRPIACLADLAGRMWCFDLSDPAAPKEFVTWECPPHPWGAFQSESLFDVALDGPGARAFVAAGRMGILAVSLADSRPMTEWIENTPGIAEGVHLERAGSLTRLWVGDQKGGLRVYALDP
jgi:hypothetical protein